MVSGKQIFFIIVAAGGGTRFGGDIPKQFRMLDNRPVLCHSIDTFNDFCRHNGIDGHIYVVLSPQGRRYWNTHLLEKYCCVNTVIGGPTRAQSVSAALKMVSMANPMHSSIVMIHDGARPLISNSLLGRLVDAIYNGHHAVVPACSPTDSLMSINQPQEGVPVDRSCFVAVQTPQAFHYATISRAYEKMADRIATMTDDASVVYSAFGTPIHYVEGDVTNIKITNPADLPLAHILLCSRSDEPTQNS